MMRRFTHLLGVVALSAVVFSAVLVSAQDATPVPAEPTTDPAMEATIDPAAQPTMDGSMAEATADMAGDATQMPMDHAMGVTCDSDLILNLYIAERYFGFGGVSSMMTGDSMLDLTTFDKGQYAPLFGASMMTTPPTMMTQEQIQSTADMMAMDDAALMEQMSSMVPEGTDMSSMTMLSAAAVADEDASCTMLRSQLNRFYSILAFQDMQMGMMGSGTGAEATADASTGGDTSAAPAGETMNFGTALAGTNEVPGPGDEDGTGMAAVTLDMSNGQVCYNLSVQNITLPAAAAHIHRGAAGESGPVVVPFDVVPDASGNAASCVLADAALLQEIASNPAGFYVNVHTSDFPDGAVRGQVSG
ncbi:MAG: CHRD domain-containing protein [Chloroflexi bacterium]|nr:CHRD domain-containing protein [Chloroflexota bacterium]MCC6892767.1 CHRD domain-containing protein [Anaerolineae bacterium]